MGLGNKRRVFVEEYLTCWNATEAALRAGYSAKTSKSQGSRLLTNVDISAEIERRLGEKHVSSDEALSLLADMACGDLGDFMDITPIGFVLKLVDDEGIRKNTRLIRKIKQKTTTYLAKSESDEDREVNETEIELYDAQAAIDKILRVAGKYKDSLDLNVRSYAVTLEDDD